MIEFGDFVVVETVHNEVQHLFVYGFSHAEMSAPVVALGGDGVKVGDDGNILVIVGD